MMKLAKVFYIFYNINYKQYKINYALNQDHSSLQKFWNFLDAYPKKVHQNQNRRSRLCQRPSPTTAYFLRHLFRKWGGQIREYIGGPHVCYRRLSLEEAAKQAPSIQLSRLIQLSVLYLYLNSMNASGIRMNLLRDFLEKATGVSRKRSVEDGDGVRNGRVMDGVGRHREN